MDLVGGRDNFIEENKAHSFTMGRDMEVPWHLFHIEVAKQLAALSYLGLHA